LRRIFELKRDEATEEWRKVHHENLTDLYSSPNIIWVIKTRRIRLVGHVARMVERICSNKALAEKHYVKRPLG
jgi:hypothetical protein